MTLNEALFCVQTVLRPDSCRALATSQRKPTYSNIHGGSLNGALHMATTRTATQPLVAFGNSKPEANVSIARCSTGDVVGFSWQEADKCFQP